MTTNYTGSTDRRLSEANRYAPATKPVNFGGYQFWLTGGVRIVTNLAGSPLVSLVYMKKVQIEHTISKVSLCVSPLLIGQGIVVAVETEGVLPFIKREIKIFRVVLFQQVWKAGAVGGVA